MAAASDGMFESSARSDRLLKSLEVESAHSSQGLSKKWSKFSVVSSPQPLPPLKRGARGKERDGILKRHEW